MNTAKHGPIEVEVVPDQDEPEDPTGLALPDRLEHPPGPGEPDAVDQAAEVSDDGDS